MIDATTITTPSIEDLVQLIATRAAREWDSEAKCALRALLAEVLGNYDAAAELIEETSRRLLAAEHEEDIQ